MLDKDCKRKPMATNQDTNAGLYQAEAPEGTTSQEMLVNMGPQHPSTHGVLRLMLKLEGEVITDCVPHMGYLHRGSEKLAEKRTYPQYVTLTDRDDYLCAMANNQAYVQTIETALGLEVPERAHYLRVIAM